MPSRTLPEYHLYIDETLPLAAFEKAEQDWRAVLIDVAFQNTVISHDQAVKVAQGGGMYGEEVVIVRSWDDALCPEMSLACYQSSGAIYFLPARMKEWQGWDRAPAHEIGHAMGLEHSNVAGSIMQPYIGDQPSAPSLQDGWVLWRHLHPE